MHQIFVDVDPALHRIESHVKRSQDPEAHRRDLLKRWRIHAGDKILPPGSGQLQPGTEQLKQLLHKHAENSGYRHLRGCSRLRGNDKGKLRVIKILESVGDRYMQSRLTAPSAKELYFKAVLLFLANDDAIGAAQAMQRYLDKDPTFFQTRQQKFG